MILIGQYDSPFVRRVGIVLTLYRLPFEHRPWSVFGDADKLSVLNPLTRVPTLLLEGEEVLVDSATILDHLDSLVPEDRRLAPPAGAARRDALRLSALAMGAAEKAVALFYERAFHPAPSEAWSARCRSQILGTLAVLEAEAVRRTTSFLCGSWIGHADIALGVAWRFIAEAHPGLASDAAHPELAARAARLESMPVFQAITQPFTPPA